MHEDFSDSSLSAEREREIDAIMARGRANREAREAERGQRSTSPASWARQDRIEALRDGLLMAAGHRPAMPHPIAQERYDDPLRPIGLLRTCDEILSINGVSRAGLEPGPKVAMALGTSDLPEIATQVATVIGKTRQSSALRRLIGATYPIELPTFLPAAHTIAELGNLPTPQYDAEMRELKHANIYAGGEQVQVASATSLLILSRPLLLNDDWPRAVAGIEGWLAAAARAEWAMFGSLLNANANLQDGSAWFNATSGNLLSATDLGSGGLSDARKALRDMPSESGQAADLEARTLLVNSEDEQGALELVKTLPENHQLEVVASTHIASGSWFLAADQRQAPTIGRCTITGSGGNSVSFESAGDRISSDGTAFRAQHDVGFAALGRPGLIRVDKP